jgi:hypothetical protein
MAGESAWVDGCSSDNPTSPSAAFLTHDGQIGVAAMRNRRQRRREYVTMGEAIIQMLPMMLSAALVPAPLIIMLLLLQGSGGLGAATAFVAGMTVVRLAQGVLFGYVLVDLLTAGGSAGPGPVVATLLLVLGILLWVTAIRTVLKAEDPDAPPPAWMARLRGASPLAAFAMGAGLIAIAAKQWVFTLGALGVIGAQSFTRSEVLVAYLIFVLGAELLLVLPLVGSVVVPEGTSVLLGRASTWLEQNTRPIKIAVSVIFGSYFLWKGVTGLLG